MTQFYSMRPHTTCKSYSNLRMMGTQLMGFMLCVLNVRNIKYCQQFKTKTDFILRLFQIFLKFSDNTIFFTAGKYIYKTFFEDF